MFIVGRNARGFVGVLDGRDRKAIAVCRNSIAARLIQTMLELYFTDATFRAIVHRRLT